MVSLLVGRKIGLGERARFAIFHGATVCDHREDTPTDQRPVVGFQSAVFIDRLEGRPEVAIAYRKGYTREEGTAAKRPVFGLDKS